MTGSVEILVGKRLFQPENQFDTSSKLGELPNQEIRTWIHFGKKFFSKRVTMTGVGKNSSHAITQWKGSILMKKTNDIMNATILYKHTNHSCY